MNRKIKPKEREAIIQSLKSGVVPRVGLQYIQVGRINELNSFLRDIDMMCNGGNAFRFLIGEYGSGKTFLLHLIKSIALEKGLVVVTADLSPNKRLHGSDGQAKALFSELINNISTRTKPDGNALQNVLEKFISIAREEADKNNTSVDSVIRLKLDRIKECVGGYDFSNVISQYWEGYESGNDDKRDNVLRWLKGSYNTKTDAMRDLGVRTIINDASLYDTLKIYSVFVKEAGYKGLLVCLDEMVNLYKISNTVSRKSNYEEILRMLNDSLQGNVFNIGFVMCGTPEFLTDGSRGLYSYEALRSRLAENTFANQMGVNDYNSIVLRLSNLSKEELVMLLRNIRNAFALGDETKYLIQDEVIMVFLEYCAKKIGDSYFRTPRTTIKSFIDLLSLLEQSPELKWNDVIKNISVERDVEPSGFEGTNDSIGIFSFENKEEEDKFSSFKL